MAHRPGDDLAHFRLVEEIGAGAMGTVWRATDTTLDREVAVKILPAALAEDPQLIARFEREAKLLASLNHANLAAVHGVHDADGTRFLAMELVPGEDLAERLKRGPLRIDEAIPITCRIADAVEAAHDRGVVHRDLKPANVRLTPDGSLKVLDFGLAKSVPTGQTIREGSDPPSDLAATTAGLVLGTAPYMSPEQARGRPVDTRSDIWSFGCVLWECLTGERPFRGETVSDLIAAILHHEPDWAALPAGTPPAVEKVLRRCLTKDRRKRIHHVADARIELEEALTAETGDRPSSRLTAARARLLAGALVLSLIAVVVLAVVLLTGNGDGGPAPIENPLADARIRKLTSFPGTEMDAEISPDGRFFTFVSDRNGPYDVFLGQIGTGTFKNLTNGSETSELADVAMRLRQAGFTGDGEAVWIGHGFAGSLKRSDSLYGTTFKPFLDDKAIHPTWSPDGRRLLYHYGKNGDPIFIADGVTGAAPELLIVEEGWHQHFPEWSPDGEWIYLARGPGGTEMDLWRVRTDGSGLERLTEDKRDVRYPTPIDDRTVLYVAQDQNGAGPWLWAFDVPTRTSRRAAIGAERYLSVSASADGRRLVATISNPEAGLWSVPILAGRVAGEEDVEPIDPPAVRALAPRLREGDLYYLSSLGAGDGLWRHRDGKSSEVWKGSMGVLLEPAAISPNGSRVAVILRKGGRAGLNVVDAGGGQPRSLADDLAVRGTADWSPDGKWLVVGGSVGEEKGLYKIRVSDGQRQRLHAGDATNPVWSPDDRFVVFSGLSENAYTPLEAVRPDGRKVVLPEIRVFSLGERFRFMPDGSGLVYMDNLDFHRLDLKTMKSHRLTRLEEPRSMRTFDITPDGKRIVFDRLSENSDIVLIER